ncbi:mitochondrial small ribosomal subunit Rsm22-domain-containing protein [Chytriomyces sp. MP71]|nr:mitochondrial small ribosomal subunit Rsm22-domain-containing protein [Chytriomyces sp. MP71]
MNAVAGIASAILHRIALRAQPAPVATAASSPLAAASSSASAGGSALVLNADKHLVRCVLAAIPSLSRVVAVQSDPALCDSLLAHLRERHPPSHPVLIRRLLEYSEKDEKHQLVLAHSALSTTSLQQVHNTLDKLWELTDRDLVLIESSNQANASLIQTARQYLLDTYKDSFVFAPCTHHLTCPHLTQRKTSQCIFPNPAPYAAKLYKTLAQENLTRYAYLVLRRGSRPTPKPHDSENVHAWRAARLIATPIKRDGHVVMDACMPDGSIERTIVSKRHGTAVYKSARKSVWGDLVTVPPRDLEVEEAKRARKTKSTEAREAARRRTPEEEQARLLAKEERRRVWEQEVDENRKADVDELWKQARERRIRHRMKESAGSNRAQEEKEEEEDTRS